MKNRKNCSNAATKSNTQIPCSPNIVGEIHALPSAKIHTMPDSPFLIHEDESLQELVESVKLFGVLVPTEVRLLENGEYELISGARRKYASDLAGFECIPAIISHLDKDDAIIRLVDSNIQREHLLPSERAKAYKMRLDAVKRKAGRRAASGSNSPNNSANYRSDDAIGAQAGISGDTIRNYISLTNLVPALMQLVDIGKLGLTTAYQIAGLTDFEQSLLVETIESEQAIPSFSQAQRMRQLSREDKLNEDSMLDIMLEQKKPINNNITLSGDILRKYFPKHYTPTQMESAIYKLLDAWQQSKSRSTR